MSREAFIITHIGEDAVRPERDPTGEARALYDSICAQIPAQRKMGRMIVCLDWFGGLYRGVADHEPDLVMPIMYGMSHQFLHTKSALVQNSVSRATVVGVSYYACVQYISDVLRAENAVRIHERMQTVRRYNPLADLPQAEPLLKTIDAEILGQFTDKNMGK